MRLFLFRELFAFAKVVQKHQIFCLLMTSQMSRYLDNSSKSIQLQISFMSKVFKWLLTSKVNHKLDHCQIICVHRQVIFRWDDNLVYWPGIAPGSQICATINDLFQSRLWHWVLDLPQYSQVAGHLLKVDYNSLKSQLNPDILTRSFPFK